MKTRHLLIVLFVIQFFGACDHFKKHMKKEMVVEDTVLTKIEDDSFIEPPPPDAPLPKPVTLQEWFSVISDTMKLADGSTTYQFLMFGKDQVYAIALVNPNIFTHDNTKLKINYATLSKTEYPNMDWPQVLDKIRSQLKEYSTSAKFKNSALAKSGGITIRFSDNKFLQLK